MRQKPSNVVELLRGRAAEGPARWGYTFVSDDGSEESLSWGALDARARAIAVRLGEQVRPGERALLLYPPGLDFIAAFFGCLYAGVVAVPAYPPHSERSFPRLLSLLRDARPAVALTTSSLLRRLAAAGAAVPELRGLPCLATDEISPELGEAWREPAIDGESLAFLQYTSGSTAAPKGVMVSHGNLLHNEEMIRQAFGMSSDSVVVGWLPLYHDMGLIGNVLQPLYAGAPCALMSPAAFLQQPLRWLDAISRFRGTTSGGPSFAYELCVRKIGPEERQRLDLSSWTVAFNGAEPVRADTMERFAQAFEPCGFRRAAFYPCYGLAEATLFVTGAGPDQAPTIAKLDAAALEKGEAVWVNDRPGRELVSCGHAWMDQVVLVVDPESARPLPDGQVGEIWISGPSVAQGYWRQPEVTEKEFRAQTEGGPEGPFLRTGDLGFLQGSELFVTGRRKDLIILRGRNLYPQDVELTAERSHPALRPGCAAAFSVEAEGEERLVVVQEVDRRFAGEPAELAAVIRQAISEEHEAQVHAVALIKAGTIPKTSSGKVQRRACRGLFLKGGLETLFTAQATAPEEAAGGAESEVLAFLCDQVARLAGVPRASVDPARPVTTLGLDSLGAVELSHRIEERFGLLPPLAALLEGPSLTEVADWIGKAPASAPDRIESAGTPEDELEGDQPLSVGQRALWFLYRLDPGDAAYNVAAALRVEGALDVDTLEEAVTLVTRRHSSLRSSFHPGPESPVRRVHRRRKAEVLQIDAAGWSADELRERLHREAWRPFDLENDPLLRLAVFRRSAGEHVLLIVLHHIVSDLWSLAVLKRDLDVAYRALGGEGVQIPAPPRLRYADYVRWQEQRLAGPEGERLWESWRQRLAGELPETTLPPDRPRSAETAKQGGSFAALLESETGERLRRLARGGNTTLSTVLLTGLLAVLHRYTGQEDLLVGVPTDGRDRPELSDLVGYLVNPVVVRAGLEGDPAFAGALDRVRAASLFAFEHREMPFPLLVERLQPVRDAGRLPLFQTLFVFQRSPAEAAVDLGPFALGTAGARTELAGMPAESVELESRAVRFDLELVTAELGARVGLSLRYDAGRFEPATIERLLAHLGNLLAGAAAEPAKPLSDLPLLGASDLQQVLVDLNRTGEARADGATLHSLFLDQSERTPEAVAVVEGNRSVTYRELAERVAGLAGFLVAQGLGPEEPVAVCLERRVELVEALLGVMAAGGTYVPIDLKYPRERQLYLLEDSGARLLLTRSELGAEGVRTVSPEAWQDGPAGELPERPAGLAYLIYTSGSTGRPKAVAIEHRSAVAMVRWALDVYPPAALARTLAVTSVCFDLSVFELFVPLACGGTVVLVDDALAVPGAAQHEPTLLNTVPSALAELLRQGALPSSVRTVNLAGEPLPRALVEEAYRTGTVERVFNLYGPSEDTTYSTWTLVPPGADLPVTIGRPLTGSQAYVLDAHGTPVPFGATGELYLGGAGLARGYFHRPELTAERFVPDPFAAEPGGRLYRTGDRVRYRPDGEIEFLGRADHQVKIRGFRIEPGEIEAALSALPGVREAVVLVREDAPGDRRLVAYAAGEVAEPDALRQALRERLPDYMVPAAFVILPALPRTPNGKVDRKALPAPEWRSEESYVAPRTPDEATLAAVWQEVLKLDRVGVHDNFFSLGGDSIRSLRALALAEERGLRFALPQLFRYQTIAELVPHRLSAPAQATLTQPFSLVTAAERAAVLAVLRDAEDVEDAYPPSVLQLGMLFHSGYGESLYHHVHTVRLPRALATPTVRAAAAKLAERHPVLRASFDLVSYGRPLQLVHRAVEVPVTEEDLSGLDPAAREAAVARRFEDEKARRFEWDRPPLLRFHVQHLDGGATQLFWTMHHVILDGWSLAVLMAELLQLCREPEGAALPPAPATTFRDFVALEREAVESGEAQSFWTGLLRDVEPARLLPWHPEEKEKNHTPFSAPLPDALLSGLRNLAGTAGVPLKSVLLAAHAWVLGRITGTRDVLTGLVSHGRPETADGDRVLGLFLNAVPLRAGLPGGSWTGLAHQMLETESEILPFLRYPLAEIQRETGISQLFETSFNYLDFHVMRESEQAFGISLQDIQAFSETNIPLTVDFIRDAALDSMRINLQSDSGAVSRERMRSIAELFLRVLAAMVESPEARYDTADLLAPAERQQILREWNDTARVSPLPSELVHGVFEHWVAAKPEAPALRWSRGELTYRELDRQANRIARRLRSAGAGPEVAVGLYVERSPEMIAGILGIWKAGATYVPLDPAYPRERLLTLIEDVHMPLALAQERLAGGLTGLVGQVITMDGMDGMEPAGPEHDAAPESGVTADNLAYVIFTSGSTGRPKPVGVPHRGLSHHAAATRELLRLWEHGDARVLHFSTLNFDGSLDQLTMGLLNGCCLVLREEEVWSAEELEDRIAEHNLTLVDLSTGYWSEWVRARSAMPEREGGEPVRLVYLGGEAMMSEELAVWWKSPRNRGVRLLNAYGPTETVIVVSALEVTSPESAGELFERVPIGWPMAERALHVVDHDGRLAPIGVAGELLIAGEHMARGYLGRPDLTAERFLPDPFSSVPGARLYRTGDLGRYLPDGRREFLGRIDDQVKIRGFRVELGEVEGALMEHPAIYRAVALTFGTERNRRLVAYCTPAGDLRAAPTAAELRAYLQGKLPEPMVPSVPSDIVLLDRLPLTPSGKVDRRALPMPEAVQPVRPASGAGYVAPRTHAEELLAGIWEEVLGVSPVGVDDDFFELGGHSLIATRAVSHMHRAFGVQVPVRALFEERTPALLARRIESTLREVGESGELPIPPIFPMAREGELPLSFAQQRLWFIHQLDPGSPSYNMARAMRLAGRLHPSALAGALSEVVRRHESLRTTFPTTAGQPALSIAPPQPFPLPLVDLSGLPAARREPEAARLAEEEARRPFDLGRGPLLRCSLVREGAEDHTLLVTMHHIVSDGWSIGVLVREITALYRAGLEERPSPLPELPIQYVDYAQWQRSWLSGEVLEEQLAYWRKQLAGLPEDLGLPFDRPRPALPDLAGALRTWDFPDDLRVAIHRLGRERGATFFMVTLAVFATFLSRLTGQTDVVTGSPTANRKLPEIEGLIGFFINTLVLRIDTSGPPTFTSLLERVREVALEASVHEDLPFERLVDELAPERNLVRTPLFQVMFVVQNAPFQAPELPGLTLQALPGDTRTAKFDLTLTLTEIGGLLQGSFEYRTTLFDESTIDRFVRHLLTLTGSAVADPGAPVSRLAILTAAERGQLVADALAEVRPFPAETSLHRLFERQAARTPAAVAVVGDIGDGFGPLTYAELDERANRLAARLRRLGVGPEVRVALWLDRTVELVVAILGVLKAGGAYVPIDPAYPEDRLRFLLEDAGAPVLVSVEELRSRLDLDGVETILLDRPDPDGASPAFRPLPPLPPLPPVTDLPESTAYVIYTSGSTGRPKGVPVSHANVARLLTATDEWFGFDASDVWTLFHSYAFDFSVWELWGALLYGGRLVVVPYWVSRSPEAFYDLLVRERVTVLNQTPSAFHQLAAAGEQRGGRGDLALRWVIFGGEALEPRRLAGWFARHGDRRPTLVNMYGITETTVHVTFRPLSLSDLERASVIGVPIPDLYLHVLDNEREPVPLGVPGEIHVGGAGLARGYLARPELTAERFVPDPFAPWPGARLYASGDLARRRPDGELEYLGRADQQVKIRGFRIELGEIEAALAEHPAVREVVVLARDGQDGRYLVAWLGIGDRGDSGPTPGVDELRSFLKARLPEHMIPAVYVPLETLPLTAHGKVDRRALPEPEAVRPALEAHYVAPRTPGEATMASVWAEVLGVDRVGVDDNFFALGGDSIRSIRVLALAEQRGLRFSLPQLFQHQTISELLPHRLASSRRTAASVPFALTTPEERAALPDDVEDAYPMSALQLGMLYHSSYGEKVGESELYHNVASVRLSQPLDATALRAAAARLAARHPVLRSSFDLAGFSRPLQLVHRKVDVPVTEEDLAGLGPEETEAAIARRFAEEKAHLFAWDEAPLLRFHVQHLTGGETEFFWTDHHVILDGWSVALMLAELFRLYRAELDGTPSPPVPPVPASTFREFIGLEREVLESDEARGFWADLLRDAEPARLLPWHPEEADKDRALINLVLPEAVGAGLSKLAGTAGVPLKHVLLAAHLWVVGRITGTRDVVTGLVINGRPEAADADRILGLFLNTVPLRSTLAGGTWIDLARQMFATEREILPFRRYPMAEIQRNLGVTGALFETSFNYVDFYVVEEAGQASGLKLDSLRFFGETNFPLAVSFSPDTARGTVRMSVQRDPARVNQTQLRAIIDLYLRVLAAMSATPAERYDTADLLAPAERQQILCEWNDTARVSPLDSELVHGVFEHWVAAKPDAPALRWSRGELSYRELNRQANRIARRLRSAGAGPEVAVGLYIERSPEMIASILGIWKAGATYVPLDPAYPRERLLTMIEDVRMPLALARERLAEGLDGLVDQVIAIDSLEPAGPEEDSDPRSGVTADNLAYVIFTSGSTGRPKPVGVPHHGLSHHAAATREVLRLWEYADARVLHFSTLNFDGSLDQLTMGLLNGCCLVLREEEMWSAEELEQRIAEHNLTLVDLSTGYWSEWVRARSAMPEREGGEPVRLVYLGGEAMMSEELAVWWKSPRNRDVRLLNAYGPTETVIVVSALEVTTPESAGAMFERVPIGRPMAERALHVVDEDGRLAPVGVSGELLIAGEHTLARGYLGRPDLTAERFLPDPFSTIPGARLYRTGDLGRYLPDGRREFLGRIDDQVKIRGFRIELGEVEGALMEHPAIYRAVAVVHGKGRNPRLVAYCTPVSEQMERPTAAELRAFLHGKLPEPMVPSDILVLDHLPLTPSGKVDRRALPAPDLWVRRSDGPVHAPRTDLELQLVGIWEELLGVSPVGVTDDFLDLGGHSLLAVRLMARIEHVFGAKLPIAALFEAPTVEQLAALLQRGEAPARRSPLVRLHAGGAGRPLYVVHPVGGDVFAYVELARKLGPERPVYGLQAIAEADSHQPTMEDLATQYLAAVREVQPEGPYLLAGWSLGAAIAYEMAQQIERSGGTVALLAMIDPPSLETVGETGETELLADFAADLVRLSGREVSFGQEVLEGLDMEAGLDRLVELGRSEGVLPPEVDSSQLYERFDRYRRHVKALDRYRPHPYEGQAVLFRASGSLAPDSADPTLGWSALTRAEVHVLEADHYSLLQRPVLDQMVEQLQGHLAEVEEKEERSAEPLFAQADRA